jgi:glycosyltransferase involved in cell wall biosynthesis
MACGATVVASDLPVLREVGGEAAHYCPVGDVAAWTDTVLNLLRERREDARCWAMRGGAAQRQASRFSWSRFGDHAVDVYRRVAASRTAGSQAVGI